MAVAEAEVTALPFAAVRDQTRQSHSDAVPDAAEAADVHHDGAVEAVSTEERTGIAVFMLPCGCGRASADVTRSVEVKSVLLDGAISAVCGLCG